MLSDRDIPLSCAEQVAQIRKTLTKLEFELMPERLPDQSDFNWDWKPNKRKVAALCADIKRNLAVIRHAV